MRLIVFMVSMLTMAGRVLAEEIKLAPPQVATDKSTAFQWLITTVFLVGCLVVAFKPAKRSKLE